MRKVKFLQDYQEAPGSQRYVKGDIVNMDRDKARKLRGSVIVTYSI